MEDLPAHATEPEDFAEQNCTLKRKLRHAVTVARRRWRKKRKKRVKRVRRSGNSIGLCLLSEQHISAERTIRCKIT